MVHLPLSYQEGGASLSSTFLYVYLPILPYSLILYISQSPDHDSAMQPDDTNISPSQGQSLSRFLLHKTIRQPHNVRACIQ